MSDERENTINMTFYEQQSLMPPELVGGEMGSGCGTAGPPLHRHPFRICAWLCDRERKEGGREGGRQREREDGKSMQI